MSIFVPGTHVDRRAQHTKGAVLYDPRKPILSCLLQLFKTVLHETREPEVLSRKAKRSMLSIVAIEAAKHLARCSMAAPGRTEKSSSDSRVVHDAHIAPFLIRPTPHLCSQTHQLGHLRKTKRPTPTRVLQSAVSRDNYQSLTGRQRLLRPGHCDQESVQLARSSQRPRVPRTGNPSTKVQK